jgi:hypothetical protein
VTSEIADPEYEQPSGSPVSRRAYLTRVAAAALGYTLAAGPVRAAAIKTDTEGLSAGSIKIKVQDGEMPLYYARPDGVAKPPIILPRLGLTSTLLTKRGSLRRGGKGRR